MNAIAFACLSLLFAVGLDLTFKRYSSEPRSRGIYVAGIGLVWGLAQLVVAGPGSITIPGETAAIALCVAAGVCVTASNLLLIVSLSHIDVSLGSTIYRLNTVVVVILSLLFLGEPLGITKLTAVALGVAAAILLYGGRADANTQALHNSSYWLVVLASFMRACFGVLSKAALTLGITQSTLLLGGALCWVVGGLAYAWLGERRVRVTWAMVRFSLVSGLLLFLVFNTLLLGLQRGEASIVIPVANLSFVLVLIVSVALRMEALTARKALAVALAAGCIWCMSVVPTS